MAEVRAHKLVGQWWTRLAPSSCYACLADKATTYKRLGMWHPDFSFNPASLRAQQTQPAAQAAPSHSSGWLLGATVVLSITSMGAVAMLILRHQRAEPRTVALSQLVPGRNGNKEEA